MSLLPQLHVSGIQLGVESLTGRGQRDAAAGPIHEPIAETPLERTEGLANPRLGETESLGGAAEM